MQTLWTSAAFLNTFWLKTASSGRFSFSTFASCSSSRLHPSPDTKWYRKISPPQKNPEKMYTNSWNMFPSLLLLLPPPRAICTLKKEVIFWSVTVTPVYAWELGYLFLLKFIFSKRVAEATSSCTVQSVKSTACNLVSFFYFCFVSLSQEFEAERLTLFLWQLMFLKRLFTTAIREWYHPFETLTRSLIDVNCLYVGK